MGKHSQESKHKNIRFRVLNTFQKTVKKVLDKRKKM